MTIPIAVFLEITEHGSKKRFLVGATHIVCVSPTEAKAGDDVGAACIELDDGDALSTVETYDEIRTALSGGQGILVHG